MWAEKATHTEPDHESNNKASCMNGYRDGQFSRGMHLTTSTAQATSSWFAWQVNMLQNVELQVGSQSCRKTFNTPKPPENKKSITPLSLVLNSRILLVPGLNQLESYH